MQARRIFQNPPTKSALSHHMFLLFNVVFTMFQVHVEHTFHLIRDPPCISFIGCDSMLTCIGIPVLDSRESRK